MATTPAATPVRIPYLHCWSAGDRCDNSHSAMIVSMTDSEADDFIQYTLTELAIDSWQPDGDPVRIAPAVMDRVRTQLAETGVVSITYFSSQCHREGFTLSRPDDYDTYDLTCNSCETRYPVWVEQKHDPVHEIGFTTG